MTSSKCPLCNRDLADTVYAGSGESVSEYCLVRCANCNHIFTVVDKEIDLHLMYEDEVYTVIENRRSIYGKIITFESHSIVKRLNRFIPSKGKLLDFGCGKGEFLFSAAKNGWSVMGIETSLPRATYARDVYGLEILTDSYRAGKIRNSAFDTIVFLHVLEHLSSPRELLRNIVEENLAPNGLLVIEVPRFDSLQSRIAKSKWLHLDMPRHVSHFTRKKLVEYIHDLDCEIVYAESFSVHLGVLGMVHALLSLFGYGGNIIAELKNGVKPTRAKVLLTLPLALVLESLACSIRLGGIMRIYCRRRKAGSAKYPKLQTK